MINFVASFLDSFFCVGNVFLSGNLVVFKSYCDQITSVWKLLNAAVKLLCFGATTALGFSIYRFDNGIVYGLQ